MGSDRLTKDSSLGLLLPKILYQFSVVAEIANWLRRFKILSTSYKLFWRLPIPNRSDIAY